MVAAKLLSSGVLLLALATSQSAGPSDRELLQRCWNAQTSDGRHFRVSSHRMVSVEGSGSIYDAILKRANQAVFEN